MGWTDETISTLGRIIKCHFFYFNLLYISLWSNFSNILKHEMSAFKWLLTCLLNSKNSANFGHLFVQNRIKTDFYSIFCGFERGFSKPLISPETRWSDGNIFWGCSVNGGKNSAIFPSLEKSLITFLSLFAYQLYFYHSVDIYIYILVCGYQLYFYHHYLRSIIFLSLCLRISMIFLHSQL